MNSTTHPTEVFTELTTEVDFTTLEPNRFTNISKNNSDPTCNPYGEPLTMFLMGGVGVTISSLIGVIGNILCIIVLTRPVMRSSTNVILFGLSVADLLFVIIAFLFYGLPGVRQYFCFWPEYENIIFPAILPPLYPIISAAQVASAYFTVLVTVERFIVVYRPLRARSICTVKFAVRTSLIIAIFAILFTLPTWFEFSYTNKYGADGEWTGYDFAVTTLRKNKDYVLYYINWSWLFIVRIIPFSFLIILNLVIYKKVREAYKVRKTMTQSESSEISITKMLICIVTIFLVCNVLKVYLSMREAFTHKRNMAELITLSGLFLNLNSAVNFIIYCLMGKKFRDTCAQLFCGRLVKLKRNLGSTLTSLTKISSNSQDLHALGNLNKR